MLLLWGYGVGQMQLMQAIYGLATSTEVAYFTYIYASVTGNRAIILMICQSSKFSIPQRTATSR